LRRFRSSARSSRPRRAIKTGRFLGQASAATSNLLVDWIKVPAGAFDTAALPSGEREPENETLIRMDLNVGAVWNGLASNNVSEVILGAIAWKGIDELPPSEVPHPLLEGGHEWILRAQRRVVQNVTGIAAFEWAVPYDFTSKAMRKLPEGMGILGVVWLGSNPLACNIVISWEWHYWVKSAP